MAYIFVGKISFLEFSEIMENKDSSQDEKTPAAETEMEIESNKKSEPIILKAASKFGN